VTSRLAGRAWRPSLLTNWNSLFIIFAPFLVSFTLS
jgi:hypothetical protein